MASTLRHRILVVEDDDDIREALAALLELEGYVCVAVDSAEAGLSLLPEGDFDLVVTDYALPGQTGAWMLQQACSRKWLRPAQALIVTATDRLEGADGFRVAKKPVDIQPFLNAVREQLDATPSPTPRSPPRRAPPWRPRTGFAALAAVGLLLAVVRHSPAPEGSEFQGRGGAAEVGAFGVRGFCVAVDSATPRVTAEVAPGGSMVCPTGAVLQLTYTATQAARLTLKVAGSEHHLHPGNEPLLLQPGVDVPLPFSTGIDSTWLSVPTQIEATFIRDGTDEPLATTAFALSTP